MSVYLLYIQNWRRYSRWGKTTYLITLWPSYLTFDLHTLYSYGGSRVACLCQISRRYVNAFVSYRVTTVFFYRLTSNYKTDMWESCIYRDIFIIWTCRRALNIWARGTYDISFEPAKCVHSYCSMSSQLYCVFNGETAPSGGRPAEQIWVKYVVFHSRNSVLFNMVWSNIV